MGKVLAFLKANKRLVGIGLLGFLVVGGSGYALGYHQANNLWETRWEMRAAGPLDSTDMISMLAMARAREMAAKVREDMKHNPDSPLYEGK